MRPKLERKICCMPGNRLFKPNGIPGRDLEQICLSADEFESIRLADLEGLYHDQAAASMGISRQTFGRILESARKKIADAIINQKALKISDDPE